MRTISAQESAALASPDGYQSRVRVQIKDSGGTFRDYSTLEGIDWILNAEWNEDIDQPVATARLTLALNHYDLSLSPLMGGKLSGYVDIGREVKVEVATLPKDVAPTASDWLLVFHGYADQIGWGDRTLAVDCSDLGSKLQDTFIEVERTYSSASGTAVQTVMQSILDDNLGAGVVTLYTPTSPGWMIKAFIQRRENVLDALTTLAAQIGWVVRYKWDAGTSAFRLTLYSPDRAKTAIDRTIGPSTYLDVKQLVSSKANVRNAVQVIYSDSADLDTAGVPKRKTVTITDTASITKYGRQWMEIAEGASSQIDTSVEASKMANAALADLKDPKAEQEIELHLFPHAEVGDLYRFTANGVHYSADQDLAVVSISHSVSPTEARTSVVTRGTLSGPRSFWLGAQAAPGTAPSTPPTTAPPAGTQTRAEIAKALQAGYVGPAAVQPGVNLGSLVSNADFEAGAGANRYPDSWALTEVGNAIYLTTDAYSGGNAVEFFNDGVTTRGSLTSARFLARPGDYHVASLWGKRTAGVGTGVAVLNFYDSAGADAGSVTISDAVGNGGATWTRYAVNAVVPAAARYAAVRISGTLDVDTKIIYDSVVVTAGGEPYGTVVFLPDWGPWGDANFRDARFWRDAHGVVRLEGLAKNANAASLNVFALPVGFRPSKNLIFICQGSGGVIEVRVSASDGVVTVVNPTLNGWHSLSNVSFRAEQ